MGKQSKGGRPVTIGATKTISLKLPARLLEEIDAFARGAGVGRSEAIRRLLTAHLAFLPRPRTGGSRRTTD